MNRVKIVMAGSANRVCPMCLAAPCRALQRPPGSRLPGRNHAVPQDHPARGDAQHRGRPENLLRHRLGRDHRRRAGGGEGGILPLASQASHEPHSPLPFSTSSLQTNEGSM